MSTASHKKSKLHGKSLEHRRNALKAADAKEVAELNKRIAQETPPKGSNPLSLDRPSDSFTPGSADAADESAAGASTPAAAASSGEATPRNANKAAKQAARASASGTVIYGAVRKFSELPISARTLQALTDASFTRLTDIQRAAIPHALAGRDILGAARTGSGKCWGAGTKLMLFDGRSKCVEDIVAGDQLMGDDGTPRTVQAGSVHRGNTRDEPNQAAVLMPLKPDHCGLTCKYQGCSFTANSVADRTEHEACEDLHTLVPAVESATYRITSHSEGRHEWTCNMDHILVLKFNERPSAVRVTQEDGQERLWAFEQFEARDGRVLRVSCTFATEVEAEQARVAANAAWEPLVWEGPVHAFLRFAPDVQCAATMYQPTSVRFGCDGPSLREVLTTAYCNGREATDREAELVAWAIGVWLTASVMQIKGTPVVEKFKRVYEILSAGEDQTPSFENNSADEGMDLVDAVHTQAEAGIVLCDQFSAATNAAPVFDRVLKRYGALSKERFPHELLSEPTAVRLSLLAGVVDGSGHADGTIEVAAQHRSLLDGVIHLARGLGFSASKVAETESRGHRVSISGSQLHNIPTALQSKQSCVTKSIEDSDALCAGFTVEKIEHRDYFGFTLDGNGRCLMDDFVVTHNTLAYLVPVLERLYRERWGKLDGVGALIIVPTRELAMQIFDVLRSSVGKTHSYSAGLIIGGKDLAEEQERIGGMNILICTPGRILQHFEQTYGFQCDNLQILVLDEADRILDLGFSQAMSDIISYLPAGRQTLLFSATQTRNLKELAKLSLREPEYIAVHESATTALPNKLVQHYTIIAADQKINLLYSYIKTHLQVKSIVFLSSGKQKMKQAKRMSIYYDFCAKSCALLFCTDLAARGLDFPEVDWVVQMDAPENTATYIHRVGRTARYRSGGKSLLFLLPSELAFISSLLDSKKVTEIKKVKADATKMKDVTAQFAAFLAENTELKFLAQKAFVSYVRSVSLQTDKNVFKAEEIPFDALAKSMGLLGTPKVKLPKTAAAAASSASHREKNMPHKLRELLAEKKEGSAAALAKQARKEARKAAALGLPVQPQTAVDKILSRKNATVFSEARSKLRAQDEEDAESEDDILVVRRRDHDLSDDDDEEGVELSSESDAASAASDEEGEEGGAAVPKPNKAAVRAELEKRMAARGAEIETRGLDSASSSSAAFLEEARQRVQEHDPEDRRAEHARVRAKHVAQKIAAKRHKRETEREKAAAEGGDEESDDGVVVTLGRPDGEDDEEEDNGAEAMEDDDDDDQSQQDGSAQEEEESDEEAPAAAAAAGSKRKGAAAASSAAARPAKQSAAKKQRTAAAAPSSLADQEALALKILGQQR